MIGCVTPAPKALRKTPTRNLRVAGVDCGRNWDIVWILLSKIKEVAFTTSSAVNVSEIYVITGSWNGEVRHAQKIFNSNFEEGISSSLQVAFTNIKVEKLCVTLVDLIGISATAIERLVKCQEDLAIAHFDDHSQPPLIVHQRFFEEFREQLRGDVGLKQILKNHQEVARIYIGDIATDQDLDTLG